MPPPSRLRVAVRDPSFNGRYEGRWPGGDKPWNPDLVAQALSNASASASLNDFVRFDSVASSSAAANGDLQTAIRMASSASVVSVATGDIPTIGSNVVHLSGYSGAGSKSTSSIIKWEDFSSRALGAQTFDAGFDFKGGNDGGLDSRKIVVPSGIGSGKAFRHRAPLGTDSGFASQFEAFHHAGYFLPTPTDELLICTQMKVVVSGGANPPSGTFQVKAPRAGYRAPGETDGQALYLAVPRCFASFYPGTNIHTVTTHHGYFTPIDGAEHALHTWQTEDFYDADLTKFVFVQIRLKLNTMTGSTPNADGIMEMWINGHKLTSSRSDLAIRNSLSQLFGSVQMNPGTTGIAGTDFDVFQTQNYIDASQCHVVLTNNAVYPSSTNFAVQPLVANTWADDGCDIIPNYNGTTGLFVPGAAGHYHIFGANGARAALVSGAIQ